MRRHPRQPSNALARAAILAIAPLATLAWTVQAQERGSDGRAHLPDRDPGFAVTRTVHYRIAYKGLERQDNPVRSYATTFPAQVFQGAMATLVDHLADDSLGEFGSMGVLTDGGGAPMSEHPGPGELGPGAARRGLSAGDRLSPTATTPLGAQGRGVGGLGGAIQSATGDLGSKVGDALRPLQPVQQGGGG